jgi:hypothetical protein
MNYRIYYAESETYDGEPQNAPAFGVLLILEKDAEHGRRIVSGGDYYGFIVAERRWRAFDQIGMIDYLAQSGWKKVVIGRMVSNQDWQAVYRKAEADMDFPARTAYGVYEKRP